MDYLLKKVKSWTLLRLVGFYHGKFFTILVLWKVINYSSIIEEAKWYFIVEESQIVNLCAKKRQY